MTRPGKYAKAPQHLRVKKHQDLARACGSVIQEQAAQYDSGAKEMSTGMAKLHMAVIQQALLDVVSPHLAERVEAAKFLFAPDPMALKFWADYLDLNVDWVREKIANLVEAKEVA
jgi:hypothetical protein